MKVIILAAGMGTRLGLDMPKSLIDIGGKTILQHQLKNLNAITDINNITLVLGYKSELIRAEYPDLSYVLNPDFKTTNTSKSLHIGIENVDDDILFMNGDVVFDPKLLLPLIKNIPNNLVFVNNAEVGDEEIKYSLDLNGYIKEISKQVVNPLGEAVGINYIKKNDLEMFRRNLELCNDNDYFEMAIELSIDQGIKFKPQNIGNTFCHEIDFPEDLEIVKRYLNNHEA